MAADSRPARAQAPGDRRSADGASSWLALIDIDHFKRVNDTHGHLMGDEVLLMSRLMRTSFRHHDTLYRFGGEEFDVLMRCDDPWHASAALERFRMRVQGYGFAQVVRVTVSIGCTAQRAGDAPAAAFERVDKAVHLLKQHGRNAVAHYDALVTSGRLVEAAPESDVELC